MHDHCRAECVSVCNVGALDLVSDTGDDVGAAVVEPLGLVEVSETYDLDPAAVRIDDRILDSSIQKVGEHGHHILKAEVHDNPSGCLDGFGG